MLKLIYITGIAFISLFIIYMYFVQQQEHKKEVEITELLEDKFQNRQRELRAMRSKTKPCHIKNLSSPKRCYYDSNYKCIWNEQAERCDQK